MNTTEQIAAIEARIEVNTEAFVNNDAPTCEQRYEQRSALSNQIREDAAVLQALKQAKERQ